MKICVFTSTRADYGLLYWTLKALDQSPDFELNILVTGSHLVSEFGNTVQEIERDGFAVTHRVENLLASDSPGAISKSLALGVMGYGEVFDQLRPDLLILLGDRFETFAAAAAATIHRVPIVHLHGGETTEGAIDEAFRHSITKMSHFHFVSLEEYRYRVIQLGENPARVKLVGALGLENIERCQLMPLEELEQSLGCTLGSDYFVVTFHPVTLETLSSGEQVEELLSALSEFPDYKLLFTLPNADTDGRAIMDALRAHTAQNPERAFCFSSLGRLRYLSAVAHSRGVIGNSSSGILEVPSLGVGTVDIGDRQKGRVAAGSVLRCEPTVEQIRAAVRRMVTPEFQTLAKAVTNPYWHGRPSERILEALKDINLDGILKKTFFDLDRTETTIGVHTHHC